MNPTAGAENLKREIGVRALTLAIVNQTIGTGIFVIPALIAENLGAAAIVAYLVCGALIFLIALCFAELGSKTTASGGVYQYIEHAFGPFAGFLANTIYCFGASVISDAALANALSDTLKYFFPSLAADSYRVIFFILLFGGLILINIRSVKSSVRFIEIAALGKLIPLLGLVVMGIAFISKDNLHWTIAPNVGNIGAASLLLFYAFMGFETPLSNGGELKNARRTVPLGIFFGILSVLIIYLAIQLVTQGVLGATIAAHKDAPLAAVAGIIFGKAGITLIIVTTAISMLGCLGGELLSIPRILYAGARNGLMPKAMARVHSRFFTPYIAIIVYAALGFLFAVFGGFKQLAILASASSLIIYLAGALATLQLRRTEPHTAESSFRVAGGPVIPLLAVAVIIWLLSNLEKKELFGFGIFIAAISLIYFISRLLKKP